MIWWKELCAFKKVYSSDILVVIGYGINDNDHHLTSMNKDFVLKRNKKLIYVTKEKINNEINKKLKIDKSTENIKYIIVNDKETNEEVVERIFKQI